MTGRFRDRVDAGRLLGRRLAVAGLGDVVVAGLPRGGVPVAAEVARALGAPLDVVVVRKIGVPWQPEVAMGAVGEAGVLVVNPHIAARVPGDRLDELAAIESAEVERRVEAWRGGGEGEGVAGRTVVLVDDGIATGATVRAAIAVLRARAVARIVLAVPVAPREAVEDLRPLVDDLVCLLAPDRLYAVGAWYEDFRQVADGEVRALLEAAHGGERAGSGAGGEQAGPGAGGEQAGPGAAAEEYPAVRRDVRTAEMAVPTSAGDLPAVVSVPDDAAGLVLFAHGSGSSRLSPRNARVARMLNAVGLATVLLDLLSEAEANDRSRVFDIELLAHRLGDATRLVATVPDLAILPLGYFGASTGAAAALWAAADHPDRLGAVVSRGGRPDLAAPRLADVTAPTLLVVGALDTDVLALNRWAREQLTCASELRVVPGATHLFEEPGTLEVAGDLAATWFRTHLFHGAAAAH
ncbi:phosphoribosyltransferase family protein [Georgenia sp. SYP-B2076]|uniref:phosphoribosyltransferase family protein n=1 Tax=Georgenia sp. SYP-B2076 TaxID=2495881 RepID=UPI001F0C0F96|nr:phosphoribosyltransferase family protein [Georgenia sp. SYP-B2076]